MVKALLAGQKRADYLQRIFLWIRFLTRGKAPTVKDVGDFVAHRYMRDQGVTWEKGRDFILYTSLRQRTLRHDPAALSEAMFATCRLIGRTIIEKQSGRRYETIEKNLKSALSKVSAFDGGGVTFSQPLSQEEEFAFNGFYNLRGYQSSLSQESLISELATCLEREGALLATEKQDLFAISDFVAVFAIAQMHLSELLWNKKTIGTLKAGTSSNKPDMLVVHIYCQPDPNKMNWVAELFTTTCNVRDWCDASLLPKRFSMGGSMIEGIPDWNVPLDLTPQGRLVRVVPTRS